MNSNKSWRALLVANLLVVLLVTTGSGLVINARATSAAQETSDETKITAEEEQEAREVAERFIRRMQETHDLAPLLGEMFVPDYAARLRQEASNKPLALMSRSAAAQASREELVRYQLALNNSLYLASLIFLAYQTSHPAEDVDQEWGAAYYKRMLPPDIIELCRHDPILKVLFEEEIDEGADENRPAASSPEKPDVIDHDDEPIRSVEQLRSFTSTLEQAITLARRHLAAAPRKLTWPERHKGANEEENWTAERRELKPRAWTLTQEFYGYPKGTRLFCVSVAVYHMDLIRVDGKLKVLALDLDTD
jgi:hypothetical protein